MKPAVTAIIVLLAILSQSEAAPGTVSLNKVQSIAQEKAKELPSAAKKNPFMMLGLSSPSDVVAKRSIKLANGQTKTRFQQVHQGVKVWDSIMVLEQDSNGEYTGNFGHGSVAQGLGAAVPSVTGRISPQQALNIALAESGLSNSSSSSISNLKRDKTIYIISKDDINAEARLAYTVDFFYETPRGVGAPASSSEFEHNAHRPFYIIDANNGAVLATWDQIASIRNTRRSRSLLQTATTTGGFGGTQKLGSSPTIAKRLFRDGVQSAGYLGKLSVQQSSSTCTMRNAYVYTRNWKSSTSSRKAVSVTYPCSGEQNECGYPSSTCNGGYSPNNEAHFAGTKAFEMLDVFLDRIGSTEDVVTFIKGGGIPVPIELRTHYSSRYENAFFDGVSLTFGDGANVFHPLSSIDVVHHELCHAATQAASNLAYSGQSGGMNEAFSDMCGKVGEYYITGTNNWLIGNDVYKSLTGYLRNMEDPTAKGSSIACADNYYNGLDVHYSSGVYNSAFVRLAKAWDIQKAFDVMFLANYMYWNSGETFVSGACDVVQAATDLQYSTDDVETAFDGVCVSTSACAAPVSATCTSTTNLVNVHSSTFSATKGVVTQISFIYTGNTATYCTVKFSLSGSNGDADLYIRKGSTYPTTSTYDWASYSATSNEAVAVQIENGVEYRVSVHAYSAFTSVTFKVDTYGTK